MGEDPGSATVPEKKAPTPPPPPLWVPILSAASEVTILASSYFLLKIYVPFLAEIPLGGSPGTTTVGFGVVFGVVYGLIQWILRSEHLADVREAMEKLASLMFKRRRVALALAPAALVLALGTWRHWQSSATTPVLRIEPAGAFADYLDDGKEADKPPGRTFEIGVEVREGAGMERLYPQDERAIEVGASESVLRWRASREEAETAPKKRSYLATARLRPGAAVTIRVFCRQSGEELFQVRAPVSEESVALAPEDDDEFSERMKNCVPIRPV
ncbi:MAG: hypothetical protein ABUT39_18190 [Acidobacteriota bacterium]